nr:GFA family protein [Rubellimicrobium arenae]
MHDSCLCGGVTVTFDPTPGEITACHCTQCRKISGHVPHSFDDPHRVARIAGRVATFTSPGGAVRSFCPICGTKVAFDGPSGLLSLEAGLFDQLAGRAPDLHIFTADKGDYYDLPEGASAYPGAGPD